jgi:glycine betaine/proline transport system ATP-binding protein
VIDSKGRFKGAVMLDEVTQAVARNLTRMDEFVQESELQIGPDEPIEGLIPLAASSNNPVAVVDEEGRLVGEVPHAALLLGMMGEEDEEAIVKENNNSGA